jgi:uncharacterized protein YbjT (DUF2867 family)
VSTRVAVIGATGFVGRSLVDRLVRAGHDVVAVSRSINPDQLPAGVEAVSVDIGDAEALDVALVGVQACYYLVHSMSGGDDFAERDRALAGVFADAAARAGVERIVYLGGLGHDPSSTHLSSRQEVGRMLGRSGVPVVELRAAIILGAGSISFEMLRYLAERLPAMVCPTWVQTRIQPLARDDLLAYLEQSLDVAPGIYEIGGEVTTYREMLTTYARVRGLRSRYIVDIPLLTPRLSAYWVDLVTPVDRAVSHSLIESLVTEVVVRDPGPTEAAFDVAPLGLADAIAAALDDQRRALPERLFDLDDGPVDGVYAMQVREPVREGGDWRRLGVELAQAGGDLNWYGVTNLWRLRLWAGRAWGEEATLSRPETLVLGAPVDWWTVVGTESDELVLETRAWAVGEAWLGYRLDEEDGTLWMAGALRPKGVTGFLYWKALEPIHRRVFVAMARRRIRQPLHRPRGRLRRWVDRKADAPARSGGRPRPDSTNRGADRPRGRAPHPVPR